MTADLIREAREKAEDLWMLIPGMRWMPGSEGRANAAAVRIREGVQTIRALADCTWGGWL